MMNKLHCNLYLNILEDHNAVSIATAKKIKEGIENSIEKNKTFVLGLATGATLKPVYKELIRMHKKKGLSFENVIFFNLDNYIGLPENDRNSYSHQLRQGFLNQVGAQENNIHLVTTSSDFDSLAYEQKIKDAGGIDIQLLGSGTEGHIGFNEKGARLDSRTDRVDLAKSTIRDNGIYFSRDGEQIPTMANTMGIATIMEAKSIILLANGPNKAKALNRMMHPFGNVPLSSDFRLAIQSAFYNRLNKIGDVEAIESIAKRFTNAANQNQKLEQSAFNFDEFSKAVAGLPARALHHPEVAENVTVFIDKDSAQLIDPNILKCHSSMNDLGVIEKFVQSYTPISLTVTINKEDKTIWIPPGFKFFDPNIMAVGEAFDHTKSKHIASLKSALKSENIGVFAHPDDAEISSGLPMLGAKNGWLTVIVTDGAMSVSHADLGEHSVKELVDIRWKEQCDAAVISKTPAIHLSYPSAAVNGVMGLAKQAEVVSVLASWVNTMPNIKSIYTHNPIDKHPTHLGILNVLAGALYSERFNPKIEEIYGMKVWGGVDALPEKQFKLFSTTDQEIIDKIEAMVKCYKSQNRILDRLLARGTVGGMIEKSVYATNPYDNKSPLGSLLGIDITELIKHRMTVEEMVEHIWETAYTVKKESAGQHKLVMSQPDNLPWNAL